MSRRRLPHGPGVMGIVNVTPDSFSDGGRFVDPALAVEHGVALVGEGASAIDVGAESTRPGAAPVPAREETRRLAPVVRALRDAVSVPISIDTRNAATAAAALEAGADVLNDVSGLRHDPELAAVAAEADCELVLMHSRGTPRDMTERARYGDVVAEVRAELTEAVERALAAGCREERLLIDPGFGFAKTADQSLELLRGLPALASLGLPVLVGVSRKSMIGWILRDGDEARPVGRRVHGSVGAGLAAIALGARWLRVHDVAAHADALAAFRAVLADSR